MAVSLSSTNSRSWQFSDVFEQRCSYWIWTREVDLLMSRFSEHPTCSVKATDPRQIHKCPELYPGITNEC